MKAARPPAFWASAMMCRAQRQVEGEGAGRDRGDLLGLLVPHAHDRTLPKLPLYLGDGGVYGLASIHNASSKKRQCID
jgi:hypothetical protein